MRTNEQIDRETVRAAAAAVLADEPELSRYALSRRVCERLHWYRSSGDLADMQCRAVLGRLEKAGAIELPSPRPMAGCQQPPYRIKRRQPRLYQPPRTVDTVLPLLGELRLVPVTASTPELSKIWNELAARYHYLGCGPLCGRQLRYLVESKRYGYLGALAFTSAALYLSARDKWIGWDDQARRDNLGKVVCNARFLIFPWVKVRNLASKILSLAPKVVCRDWLQRYGEAPVLLETFIDPKRFRGSCYLAAGWQDIGQTKGRGRQDRHRQHAAGVKRIFVQPLSQDFREQLQRPLPRRPAAVDYRSELAQPWEKTEFATLDLGDRRLNKRVERMAADFFRKPMSNIPEACGDPAAMRAAYRLLARDDVSMEKILAPHFETTAGRVAASDSAVILAVQDTTFLNYSSHPETEGLGPIGTHPDGPVGMILHDTMTFTTAGTPLGLIDIQCWTREPESLGQSRQRRGLPIGDKESVKWLASYDAASYLQRRLPDKRIVSVGDREADFYALFAAACDRDDNAELLVRATHNRTLLNESVGLKAYLRELSLAGYCQVKIPRRQHQRARIASMSLRYGQIELKDPKDPRGKRSVQLNAVHIAEAEPLNPNEPIEWFLLTTCPVGTVEDAFELVQWYAKRWGIEVYHRIIKSGCRIEDRQLSDTARLENCLAVDLVAGWRVFHLTMLGREAPKLPCTVCLSEHEWQVLQFKYHEAIPEQPPSLLEAILLVARLGGYVARPKDHMPGPEVIWRGLISLMSLADGWAMALKMVDSKNGP